MSGRGPVGLLLSVRGELSSVRLWHPSAPGRAQMDAVNAAIDARTVYRVMRPRWDVDVWADEDGGPLGLVINPIATRIAHRHLTGPVVFTGYSARDVIGISDRAAVRIAVFVRKFGGLVEADTEDWLAATG